MFKDNPDFYPTPKSLISKMLNKIDFRYISSVLEPSAGKGDLIEAITQKFKYHQNRHYNNKKYDIDAIEVDNNLQHILQGKKFRLVHDDYLSYDTFKKYDAIIMNPPFSNGDKHLLKAIEMQKNGGKIVCLLNAETLRNPYSNTRKDLIAQLDKYNAEVEFLQDAFTEAERKTNVETVIIFIDIPKIEHSSVILDELKQEEAYKAKSEYNSDKLIESDFIRGIVQQYNYEVKAGLRLIEEYNSLVPYMLGSFKDNGNPVLKLGLEYEDKDGSNLENGYIKQIRLKYWKALFNNEQFMGLFTSNLKQKYMQQVEELKDYDFSFYNIYTIRIQLNKEMIQGVEDTILNLFEEFSYKHYYDESSKNIHMYNGWKTNKAYKINKKVIIPLSGFDGWMSNPYNPTRYQVKDKLKDIEKVFNYLDSGRTEEIDLEQALKMAEHYKETRKIDLKYFYVTFYKKGTTHIEFKDMELLKKFNLFGSQKKGFLPPSYGKASYNDMTSEEREVIDNFEGEKSYNDVMRNRNYYIVQTEELLRLTS
ncbi:DNA N-6-adenine-methyltransferase [Bacillus sp. AG4(2022)]|uniref:DNA N-6-adenine-methyltransferase n=1 Tax=Bacillus sp. AG4(2022) TaxID=2962594 RepID=UPI002882B958|nr:DNA N-6-adenine-methyltransferase [Bacillus sp. AG4(2022)]MDT0160321.1 DNA N-6-adenine-methyltransferase [Bacillus sp. AG4(2022)]